MSEGWLLIQYSRKTSRTSKFARRKRRKTQNYTNNQNVLPRYARYGRGGRGTCAKIIFKKLTYLKDIFSESLPNFYWEHNIIYSKYASSQQCIDSIFTPKRSPVSEQRMEYIEELFVKVFILSLDVIS